MINFVKVRRLGGKSWLSTGKVLDCGRSRTLSLVSLGPAAGRPRQRYRLPEVHIESRLTFLALVADDDVRLHPDSELRSTPLLSSYTSLRTFRTPLHTSLKPLQLKYRHPDKNKKPLRLQA